MQISFDPRDRGASASVLAIVLALHPDIESLFPVPAVPGPVFESADPTAASEFPDEQPDPAAAFGAGNPAPSVSPVAPTAAATPPSPEPVASPPIPSAPVAPSSGVELDADGLPWDARIHSGPTDSKPKNADGRWRRKRGVDDATVAAVTAELRQVMGAPVAPPAPTPAAAPTPPPPAIDAGTSVTAPPAPPVAVDPAPPAPVAPAPTAAPTPPPPTPVAAVTGYGQAVAETAASAPPTTFAELMKRITARQTAGTLSVGDTKATAEALGLTGVADLLKRPDLIEAYFAALPAEAA